MPVQSVVTLRQLGDVDREMIEHRVRSIMEFRSTGQVDAMASYLSPDVVCLTRGAWAGTLFPRPVVGKAAVTQELYRQNMNYQNLDSEFHELLIDGDWVALHRTSTGRNRGSGRPYRVDVVTFLRFRDGLVTEISEYLDSSLHEELDGL